MISSCLIVEAKTGEARDSQDDCCTVREAGTGVGASRETFGRREETAYVRGWNWAKIKSRVVEDRLCSRPFCSKPEIQHNHRGRGMPTLTGETFEEKKRWCCSFTKKEIMSLRFYKSDLLVCKQGACFLQCQKVELAHCQCQKEMISCTRFLRTGLALDGKYL